MYFLDRIPKWDCRIRIVTEDFMFHFNSRSFEMDEYGWLSWNDIMSSRRMVTKIAADSILHIFTPWLETTRKKNVSSE